MKEKTLRCFAAACFFAMALILFAFEMTDSSIWNYLYVVGFLLLAIGLLIDQPILSAVGCVVQIVILGFILLIDLIDAIDGFYWSFYSLPSFAFRLFLLAAMILLMLSALLRKNGKKFGILSGILFATGEVICFVFNRVVWSSGEFSFSSFIPELLDTAFFVAGAILMGLAMKAGTTRAARTVPAGGALGVSERIDQLTKLKELLDKGILTQEEFEEKKEKILQK